MMFSLVCFSLYGQVTREPKFYIAPIEGFGRETDNDYIHKRLTYEVILQYHTVVKLKYDSDFIFKGTIELSDEMTSGSSEQVVIKTDNNNPVPGNPIPPISNEYGRREFFSMVYGDKFYFFDSTGTDNTIRSAVKETESLEPDAQKKEKKYYLNLELIDNRTEEVISKQNFVFVNADASVDKLISTVISSLLSDISNVPLLIGDSRDRWIYIETSALYTPRIYYEGIDSTSFLGFGVKLGLEFHFLKFLSLGAGVQVTWEQIEISDNTVTDFLLEVPLSLKYGLKLSDKFALEPYGGASINFSLGDTIQPSMFSWFAGVQFGIKDKKETGMFVFDLRFAMDFANPSIPDESIEYQRYCFQVGIGYKFGFFQRRDKAK